MPTPERDHVGVLAFLPGLRDAGHRQVVLDLRVAEVSTDVEVAERLSGVEAEAVEVGIILDLGFADVGRVGISLTHVEGNTERAAAGGGVVEAEDGAIDVGFRSRTCRRRCAWLRSSCRRHQPTA